MGLRLTRAHDRVVPFAVGVACGYECAAILSGGRLPTISHLQHKHRAVGVLVVGWLAYHFVSYKPKDMTCSAG